MGKFIVATFITAWGRPINTLTSILLTGSTRATAKEALSYTGPNQVLFDYLGNPVPPPANLDAAYTKEGMIQALQTAVQQAGITLTKLEIDDSEFPFLVGVVFAGNGDKEKLMEQIEKLPAYKSSGGVGGELTYSMNIVPYSAFPREAGDRIYHRMMLREAVLFDRINAQK